MPHPRRCFTEPVRVPIPVVKYSFGLSYIKANGDPPDAPGVRSSGELPPERSIRTVGAIARFRQTTWWPVIDRKTWPRFSWTGLSRSQSACWPLSDDGGFL